MATAKGPKIDGPSIYSGDPATAEEFLTRCQLVFRAYPNENTTDAAKIHFALAFIKGGLASVWATDIIDKADEYLDPTSSPPGRYSTWDKFKEAFLKRFEERDKG